MNLSKDVMSVIFNVSTFLLKLKFRRVCRNFRNIKIKKFGPLHGRDAQVLQFFPDLEKVHLIYSTVNRKAFEYMKNIKNIKLIECHPFISSDNMSYFENAETIRIDNPPPTCDRYGYLDYAISDLCLKYLKKCKKLSIANSWITTERLPHLNLKKISLVANNEIFDEDLINLKDIEKVNLKDCKNITSDGLIHLKNVKKLNLENTYITDNGLIHLENVEYINLKGCENITSEGLKHLKNAKKIEHSLD